MRRTKSMGMGMWIFFVLPLVFVFPAAAELYLDEEAQFVERCENPTPRDCAPVRILVEEPQRSRRALLIRLKSIDDIEGRARIAEALGYVGGDGVREALVLAVEENYSAAVKYASIQSLGRLQDTKALPFLEKFQRSDDVSIRIAASTALGLTKNEAAIPALVEAIGHAHPKCQAAAVSGLGALGVSTSASETAILNVLGHRQFVWTVHERALRSIEELDLVSALPLVIGFLEHPRVEVVGRACRILGKWQTVWAIPALTRVVSHGNNVGAASVALARIGRDEVADTLNWAAMNPDLDPTERKRVFRSLALLKSPSSVVPLAQVLRTPRLELLLLTIETLGQLGDSAAVSYLRPFLEHSEDNVRAMAIWAMEESSGKQFGDRLDLWDGWIAEYAKPSEPTTKR